MSDVSSDFIVSRPRECATTPDQKLVRVRVLTPTNSESIHGLDRERAVQLIRDLRYHFDINVTEIVL